MAKVVYTSILVYPEVLFNPGHAVDRWFVRTTAELKSAVRARTPVRSGKTRASVTGRSSRIGALQAQGTVSVGGAAQYVLGGTAYQGRRYIYSNAGWANKAQVDLVARRTAAGQRAWGKDESGKGMYMAIRDGGKKYHLRVHGQKANNFLIEGYNDVARVHGALKPMRNKFLF